MRSVPCDIRDRIAKLGAYSRPLDDRRARSIGHELAEVVSVCLSYDRDPARAIKDLENRIRDEIAFLAAAEQQATSKIDLASVLQTFAVSDHYSRG